MTLCCRAKIVSSTTLTGKDSVSGASAQESLIYGTRDSGTGGPPTSGRRPDIALAIRSRLSHSSSSTG